MKLTEKRKILRREFSSPVAKDEEGAVEAMIKGATWNILKTNICNCTGFFFHLDTKKHSNWVEEYATTVIQLIEVKKKA